jgi:hypothetical protein
MTLSWSATKDPDDIVDYVLDWSARLDGDTLESSQWLPVEGNDLVIDSSFFTDTVATVWLSGGTVGDAYVLNRVTTAGGRQYDQTMKLKIKVK